MLEGKFAVITGASEGIGLGIATALAQENAQVLLIARNREKLEQAGADLAGHGAPVHTMSADLSQSDTIKQLSSDILARWPQIDILVNNAGIARFTPFEACEEAELDQHINLNLKAPFLLTQGLLPGLIRAQGAVINISSYFAKRMLADRPCSAYSASKGAIESLTKALAFELGPIGVRVNAIAPGTIDTPMVQRNLQALSNDQRAAFVNRIKNLYPLGRLGQAHDVARMVVFLASDQAEWITGASLAVDGGLTTH